MCRFVSSSWHYNSRPFPPCGCTLPPRGGIYEWELLSALLGLCLAANYAKHAPLILFVDNQSAMSALISGTGKSDIATQICAAFWSFSSSGGLNVRAEYAPSKLNIADSPSRAFHAPRGDNEITNSFGNIPLPGEFVRRVLAPIHLSKSRFGEEGWASRSFHPICFNFEHTTD